MIERDPFFQQYTSKRPSAWYLAPTLSSIALIMIASNDLLWGMLCTILLLTTYFRTTFFPWPTRQRLPATILQGLVLWLVVWLYISFALRGGKGLQHVSNPTFPLWFLIQSSLWASAALIVLWHVPFAPKGRGWAIYLLTGWIVFCTGFFQGHQPLYTALLYFYCLSMFLCALLTAHRRESQGQLWLPDLRQLALFSFWSAIVGLGMWGSITLLLQAEQRIPELIGNFFHLKVYSGNIGGSSTMRMRRRQQVTLSNQWVATISGPRPPGYLRTQLLTYYRKGLWSRSGNKIPLKKQATSQQRQHFLFIAQPHKYAPSTQSSNTPTYLPRASYDVKLYVNLKGSIPLPYGAITLEIPKQVKCHRRQGNIIECHPPNYLQSFTTTTLTQRTTHGLPGHIVYDLNLPTLQRISAKRHNDMVALYAQLRPLAQRITQGLPHDPLRAAQALQDYFHKHYTYSLKVRLADKGDPIVDFILNKRPAYCEYFASGMTLMMRSLGYHARVAGGFMVREYNTYAGHWLIRQRDAHAWTEVYDPKTRKWQAFDPTSPLSLTQHNPPGSASSLSHFLSWTMIQLKRFVFWLRNIDLKKDWKVWLSQLLLWLTSPLTWLIFISVSLTALLIILRHTWLAFLRRRWRPQTDKDTLSPLASHKQQAQTHLLSLLSTLETQLSPIAPHESPDTYLQRLHKETSTLPLAPLQAFVAQYNTIRFCPETPSQEMLVQLEHLLQTCHDALQQTNSPPHSSDTEEST